MREVTLVEFLLFLKKFVLYCLSRWKIVISVVVLSIFVYFAYIFLQSPLYSASVIFIKENPPVITNNSSFSVNANAGITLTSLFDKDNITEIFRSRDLIEACLLQPAKWLGANKIMLDGYWQGEWKRSSFLNNQIVAANSADSLKRALRITARKITDENIVAVREDKNLEYYTLTVVHENEQFANTFCHKLISSALYFHEELRKRKVTSNLKMIEKEVDSVRKILSTSIASSASAADVDVNSVRQIVKLGLYKGEIIVGVNSTLYDQLEKQLEIARMNTLLAGPVIKVIDMPRLPLSKEKLNFFKIWNITIFILLLNLILSFLSKWENMKSCKSNE